MQSTSSMWIYMGFEINRDYIENQLCINRFDLIPVCKGSCYLEEKIKEENNSSESKIKIKLLEVVMILPVFDLDQKQDTPQTVEDIVFTQMSSRPLSDGFFVNIFKPPVLLT